MALELPLRNTKNRFIILILLTFDLVLEIAAMELSPHSFVNLADPHTSENQYGYAYLPKSYLTSSYHQTAPLSRYQPPERTYQPFTIASDGRTESTYIARDAFRPTKPETTLSISRAPVPLDPKLTAPSKIIAPSDRRVSSQGHGSISGQLSKTVAQNNNPSTSRVPLSRFAQSQAIRPPTGGAGSNRGPGSISEKDSIHSIQNDGPSPRRSTMVIASKRPEIISGRVSSPVYDGPSFTILRSRFRPQHQEKKIGSPTAVIYSNHESPKSVLESQRPPAQSLGPSKTQRPPVTGNMPSIYKRPVMDEKPKKAGFRINSGLHGKKLSDPNENELGFILFADPFHQSTRLYRKNIAEHQKRLRNLRGTIDSISSAKLAWTEVEILGKSLESVKPDLNHSIKFSGVSKSSKKETIEFQRQQKSKDLLERFQKLQAIQSAKTSGEDLDYIIETLKGLSAEERGGRFWTKYDVELVEILESKSNKLLEDGQLNLNKMVHNVRNQKAYVVLKASLGHYTNPKKLQALTELFQKIAKHLGFKSPGNQPDRQAGHFIEQETQEVKRFARRYDWMKAQLWETKSSDLINHVRKQLSEEQGSAVREITIDMLKIQEREDNSLKDRLDQLEDRIASNNVGNEVDLEESIEFEDSLDLDQKLAILELALWKIPLNLAADKAFQKLANDPKLMKACLDRVEDQNLALKLSQKTLSLDQLKQKEWDKLQFLFPKELKSLVHTTSHGQGLEVPSDQRMKLLKEATMLLQRASESLSLSQKIPFDITYPVHHFLNMEANLELQRLRFEVNQLDQSSQDIVRKALQIEKKAL
ncbi:hypothetical protein PtA15_5A399 [Puccinia triticina]|uniref:Actin interacting protein 3 C-terminal domain-containing protein n=1 Tax=Puccinia triticina TaxID=208348 RepID=A0ABY7CHX5_9BASI|nr:uncharacterized protein PtA15_5A399 [Puccinia triticina]WAQ84826.1 hypothetical protein PtA15_5A399 [Puccinia triticina]